jgi:YD repeat-containing protein
MSKFLKRTAAFLAIMLFGVHQQVTAQAQTENNPISKISISSPTASSLGKYGDIPINYHTGIPKIDIPIFTVSAGPLSLPISLSYHASGLKVQEPASWVGAGWALNAGGVITRSVMGGPDEKGTNNGGIETHGHFSDYGYNNYIWNATLGAPPVEGGEDWKEVADGRKDGEPDLFFFNFGGYSGKFYFRDDRTPVVVPEADFKIEPYYSPNGIIKSIQSFIITTPEGVKYYFGQTPGLTGTAPIEITNPSTPGNGLSTANVYSSWYLHKITTTDELFSINLTYETEDYGFHTISMFPMDGNEPAGGYPTFGAAHGYDLIKNIVHGVRLSQIIFPNGTVNFSTAGMAARTDLSDLNPTYWADAVNQNAKPLGSIQITDGAAVIKKFNFSYNYFEDNATPIAQDITNFAPNLFTDKKRLRLDQMQEVSGDNSLSKPPHNFTYFSEQVPRRLSFGMDHWGYSNGVTNNEGLIPSHIVFQTNQTINYPGADRDSHWPAMRAGTLQQINYPTGGYSLFEFEPNTVYNTVTSNVNVNILNQTVHLYGQSTYTVTSSFVSDGSGANMLFNNSSNYSASFSIVNSSNAVVYSTNIGNGQVSSTNPISLPQGNYTATLSLPNYTNLTGGCTATITQWQTVTTINTITIGGNRIKTLTHNDGVTSNNIVTSYNYNGDNGQSSAILYSRPAYVGIKRNDFIRDVGFYRSVYGYQQTLSLYGCPCIINACYFKSTCSIRPMATTQGNPLGYSQVKVSQTGNGYSVYKYYGPTGVPPWQVNVGDVAIRIVNTAGCDNNAPSFPYPPLPYDFLRGELKYEAHYNEANQMLQEKNYTPVYVNNPIKTPSLLASYDGASHLATKYELTTARKTQTQLTETAYDPATNTALTTSSTSYNESPFHTEVTRTSAVNSKNEVIETKKKYAFDFRLSTCESISDGYAQYNTDCATCLANKNAAMAACPSNNFTCTTNAYLTYMHCLNTARANWVTYRRTNFTDPTNNFKTYHDNAKASADAELKPILQLQDNYENSAIETTKWKAGNLLGATFSRFDYSANPAGKVYINKVQAINLNATSPTFTNAATNTSNNGLVKDSRYQDESFVKFHSGNLAELTSKDGVTTAYLWGYNNTLPITKSIGVSHSTLLSAYNTVGGNLSQLRSQPSLSGAQLNTYVYTPITGMTAETDVNGKNMTYEYDALQRLLLIRDFNNNIIKQYDYKYQVLPPSGAPQWIVTGATRCKPCPQNNDYISNILQQEEKDNNPLSGSYNTLRWTDIGVSNACVSNADWQNTSMPIRCRVSDFSGQNTGEQEQQQLDMNPCSSSYGQIRWIVVSVNYTVCPLPAGCNSGNCNGDDKKCINNICETGSKVYTGSYFDKKTGQWMCIYHYHWSDNSNSVDYYEVSTGQCITL